MKTLHNALINLLRLARRNLGGFIIVLLLLFISISALKPSFYLAGWDNYSSYFAPKINIFRTFFSTWREYRGLGVPSDAEATDIFRQIVHLSLRLILREELLDQIYYILSLWIGVTTIYILGRLIYQDILYSNKNHKSSKDLFGSLIAFFYLYNLSTLSTFYSPIIPFTNRFWALPVVCLSLYFFFKKQSVRSFIFAAISILFSSGSFVTPTVAITSLFFLLLINTFMFGWKKSLTTLLLFFGLNLFWILPFLNYAIQKASIIPLARTFIEINESTLNPSPNMFSIYNQLILLPSFFEIKFTSLSGIPFDLHPQIRELSTYPNNLILFLFPFLYISGSVILIFFWKKYQRLLWIPLSIGFFLFLSTKEYGPLGFIYNWMSDVIPFFSVLFRISDTKFHAYIGFSGSFSAAFFIFYIFQLLKIQKKTILIPFIFLLMFSVYAWQFRSYLTGNLIGFFAYTYIPPQYKKVANIINEYSLYGRVLHVPFDNWHSYWRSFEWGYVGSAFLNFLLNKPYVDKTFEPASMENAYLHNKIQMLTNQFYNSTDIQEKSKIAYEYMNLLQKTNIGFLILDESLSGSVYARNMLFNVQQWYIQSKELFSFLESEGLITKIWSESIDILSTIDKYKKLYPSNIIGQPNYVRPMADISLYKVKNTLPPIRFVSRATFIDSTINNLLEKNHNFETTTLIQENNIPGILYPFQNDFHYANFINNQIQLSYKSPIDNSQIYTISTNYYKNDSYLIDIMLEKKENNYELHFYHYYYPTINNGNPYRKFIGSLPISLKFLESKQNSSILLSNWLQKTTSEISDLYRLQIDDVVIPLPNFISEGEQNIASVIINTPRFNISILTKEATIPVNIDIFDPTSPLSCLGLPPKEYFGAVGKAEDGAKTLSASYGSTCIRGKTILPESISDFKYAELEMFVDSESSNEFESKNKNKLDNFVLNTLYNSGEHVKAFSVCVKEGNAQDCINQKRMALLYSGNARYRFPYQKKISHLLPYEIEIGMLNLSDTQVTMAVRSIVHHIYKVDQAHTMSFIPEYPNEFLTIRDSLSISFPAPISSTGVIHHQDRDMFFIPIEPCRNNHRYTRMLKMTSNMLISGGQSCNIHFAHWLNYDASKPYLFMTNYWLGAGQQPSIVLGKDGNNYFFERASLYQGYPRIPGMKTLQYASIKSSQENIQHLIMNATLFSTSRLIPPLFTKNSMPSSAAIHLFQDTQDIGILGINNIVMIDYPKSWQSLAIKPYVTEAYYSSSNSNLAFKKILPSLWKVSKVTAGSMILLSQGYDSQWGLYNSLLGTLVGKPRSISWKCDGFANCFYIPKIDKKESFDVYLFYLPERLAIIGWITVFGTFITFVIFLIKK